MFRVKHGYRWLALGLVLALSALLAGGIEVTYAKLVDGVWARKPIEQAVELRMTADQDGKVEITIGANQITFRLQANEELETGRLRISGDVVLIKVFADGTLTDECEIPVGEITAVYKQFCYDERPPVVRASTSPEPNEYGWNNEPVTVTLTAEDEEEGSGIAAIFYKIGARSPVEVGTGQLSLSQDGRVATYSLTISDEGTHQLGFWAVDQAGNESEHATLTVRIDKTPPAISLSAASPQPGEPAVVSWEITDGLSGVDTGSCLVTISGPGITGVGGRAQLSRDCAGRLSLTYEQYGAGTFTVRAQARDLAGNESHKEEPFTIPEPYCAIEGRVVDATTDRAIAGAFVWLSPTERSTTTGAEGRFSFTELMPGTYTVTAEAENYSPSSRSVECRAGETAEVVLALSPLGEWRIVLSWGADPEDLDSHLWTPDGEHIWYSAMVGENAKLDVDDTDGYGPETITIYTLVEGTYVYAVKHYAGAGNLAHSGAQVEVHSPTELVRRFTNPPCGTGVGTWWVVFKLHVHGGSVEIEEVDRCLESFDQESSTPPDP